MFNDFFCSCVCELLFVYYSNFSFLPYTYSTQCFFCLLQVQMYNLCGRKGQKLIDSMGVRAITVLCWQYKINHFQVTHSNTANVLFLSFLVIVFKPLKSMIQISFFKFQFFATALYLKVKIVALVSTWGNSRKQPLYCIYITKWWTNLGTFNHHNLSGEKEKRVGFCLSLSVNFIWISCLFIPTFNRVRSTDNC